MGVRGQRHAPAAHYRWERPGTHYTGGWVGLRASLDWYGKSRPTGIRSPDRQPVGSRYTDYATRPTVKMYDTCNVICHITTIIDKSL